MSDSNGYARGAQEASEDQLVEPPAGKLLGRNASLERHIDIQLASNSEDSESSNKQLAPPTEAFFRGSRLHDLSASSVLRAHLRSASEVQNSEIDEVIFTPGRLLFLSGEPVHVVRRNGSAVAFFSEGDRAPTSREIKKAERYAATQPVYMRDKPKFVEVVATYGARGTQVSGESEEGLDSSIILRDGAICAVLHEGISQTLIDSEGKVTPAYAEGWLIARQYKGHDLAESDNILRSTLPGELPELLIAAIEKKSQA